MTREAKSGAPLGIDGQPIETGRLWGRPATTNERVLAEARLAVLRDVLDGLSRDHTQAHELAQRKTGWRDQHHAGAAEAFERAKQRVQRAIDGELAVIRRTGRAR